MTAADQADQNAKISLANRGRPHMTAGRIRLNPIMLYGYPMTFTPISQGCRKIIAT